MEKWFNKQISICVWNSVVDVTFLYMPESCMIKIEAKVFARFRDHLTFGDHLVYD